MLGIKFISKYQFAAFRIIFGCYLAVHLAYLIPYGPEIFSRHGTLPNAQLNFTYGILPNPLEHWDSSLFVRIFLGLLLILSLAYMLGFYRRISSLFLWYGWACLLNRNNLINNPGIPYIGFLLLASAIVPTGDPLKILDRGNSQKWIFPSSIYWTAWFLMALGYTFSGWMKLSSPSWLDGTAMTHLVNNPLARPGIMRDIFLSLPHGMAALATWSALGAELLFLPLCLHPKTRMWAWLSMIIMHLGILSMVDFADLTFGMLMIHLFTYDPDWLPARSKEKGYSLVLFDGICGLCDRTVQTLLDEDRREILQFAPLQGITAESIMKKHPNIEQNLKSLIFVEHYGTPREIISVRSEAILRILNQIGGFWRMVSWLRGIPKPLRDKVYDWISRNRYRWFGKLLECRLPSSELRQRFLP